jgi:glutathione S-transferase
MAQKRFEDNASITLGYWGIRGLAQPIRFLLVCAQEPFSELRLGVFGDGTLMGKTEEEQDWESVRVTLQVPFPNLPFLIDEGTTPPVKLTQSNAILRYLGRRFDFYGDSESEKTEIDVLQDEAYDFRNEIIKTAYAPQAEYLAAYDTFKKQTLPRYLNGFEAYLAEREHPEFFVGRRLSLVDFVLYELLWQTTQMVPGAITAANRSELYAFIQHFEAIPQISTYMQCDTYIRHPINSPWASFF